MSDSSTSETTEGTPQTPSKKSKFIIIKNYLINVEQVLCAYGMSLNPDSEKTALIIHLINSNTHITIEHDDYPSVISTISRLYSYLDAVKL